MPPDRPNQFKFLLSNDELDALRKLADQQGLNVADYLRQLIRREEAEKALAHLPTVAAPHRSPPKLVRRKPKK